MDDSSDALARAVFILQQHANTTREDPAHILLPKTTMERLVADLMHYCHEANQGKTPRDAGYIDFNMVVVEARRSFRREREATPEHDDPRLDPELLEWYRAKNEPKFRETLQSLDERQDEEAIDLALKHKYQSNRQGETPELLARQERELEAQQNKFNEERKRYAREFFETQRIAQDLEDREKEKAKEPAKEREL